ncbi:hypothetical protein [Rosistilla oblonga]|uniref:hypothetical protein n=1 Tax=Rosistilla oblonga TaxID=2527990 RepID=UPI003A96C51F
MPIHVFISETVKSDCQTHGMGTDCLKALQERIEKPQHIELFERNNPHPVLVKKKFYGRDKRLIAVQKHVGSDSVIVLLRVLIRSSSEYENNFEGRASAEETLAYVNGELAKAAPGDALEQFVRERNKVAPPTPLPEVSRDEWNFLVSAAYLGEIDDTIVCETHEFVDDLKRSQLAPQHIRIPDLILRALTESPNEVVIIKSEEGRGLRIVTYNSPETHQCVLLRAFLNADADSEQAKAEWTEKLQHLDQTTILRFCRISYPSLVCGDEQTWVRLHQDDEAGDGVANLSLSPEEGEILTSCDRYEGQDCGYPLFINGRAGSGKSTLLQYLFSFTFRRWLATLGSTAEDSTRPLYLASSGNLLRVACDASVNILSMNSSQVLQGHALDDQQKTILESCFQQTGMFMHSFLPDEKIPLFPIQNRIDYAGFRRLWKEQFRNEPKALQLYGPQVSWHIIRGLIKGFSSSELIGRDDYEGLPRDERAVSRDTFERVYDKVWIGWYRQKCNDENLWDDQDLVRCLIEEDQLPRQHVAIFCDEAQDFTRVELDAIYQCSLFSKRALDTQSVPRVPFVFAGDPFQTLNPTGFRWESVQAAFTERLIASLHRFSHFSKLPDLHYEELTFNYRSAKRIVHFCNTIQASRALLFQHNTLRPQETWRIQDDQNAPAFLDISDQQINSALKDQKDLVLIVPCEEGEESDYVSNDPLLSEIVDLGEDGVPLNVVSAARSKGLEFRRVGLYGWSRRTEAERIADLLRHPESAEVSADEKLELEYFMNNLYVAASRAQRRLFVIDAEDSRQGLWWIVDDDEHLATLKARLASEWGSQIGSMVNGAADSFQHDQDTNKRRAEQQKSEGMAKRSPFSLRQAARYFELDGNELEMHRCRGFAHRFSGRFRESAEHFEKSGDLRDAIGSLWEGEDFTAIASFSNRHPSEATLPESILATFVASRDSSQHACAELLNRILDAFTADANYRRRRFERGWGAGIDQALSWVIKESDANLRGVSADAIVDPLTELIDLGVEVSVTTIASLHLAAENFVRVMEILQDQPNSEVYRTAFALEGIRKAELGQPISSENANAIGDYLLRQKNSDWVEATRFFDQSDNVSQLRHCFQEASKSSELSDEGLAEVTKTFIRVLARHQDWIDLISVFEYGQVASTKGRKGKQTPQTNKRVIVCIQRERMAYTFAIPFFANATSLSDDPGQTKQEVQRFLKGLVGDRGWMMEVPPSVMGAAIERAGKDVDALEFYEKLISGGANAREKQYARIRWAVCKLRQAKRQGSRKNEEEARSFIDRFGISDEDLSQEFPSLTTVSNRDPKPVSLPLSSDFETQATVLPDRERVSIGELEMTYLSERAWINIESSDGLRARVLLSSNSVESSDTTVVRQDDSSFSCPELKLSVSWNENGDALVRYQKRIWIAKRVEN